MKPVLRSIALGICATTIWAQTQPQPGWRKFDGPSSAQQQGGAPLYGQPPAPPPPPAQLTLPAGSFVSVRVNETLSSDHSQQGQYFTATLAQPLIAQGFVIARTGQTLSGRVDEALKAGRVKGTSSLETLGLTAMPDTPKISELTSVAEFSSGVHCQTGESFSSHL